MFYTRKTCSNRRMTSIFSFDIMRLFLKLLKYIPSLSISNKQNKKSISA